MLAAVSAVLWRTGVIRCGLMPSGMAIRTAATTARVTAMAGIRCGLISRPISTPSANANAA